MGIVAKIKALCQAENITLNQLEKAVGLKSTIARWDDHDPSLDKVMLVAGYFGITVSELLGEEKKPAQDGREEFLAILRSLDQDEIAQLLAHAQALAIAHAVRDTSPKSQ